MKDSGIGDSDPALQSPDRAREANLLIWVVCLTLKNSRVSDCLGLLVSENSQTTLTDVARSPQFLVMLKYTCC